MLHVLIRDSIVIKQVVVLVVLYLTVDVLVVLNNGKLFHRDSCKCSNGVMSKR